MSRITKSHAIQAVGKQTIEKLLTANVEPTNRVMTDGTVELSSRAQAVENGDEVTVFMYVFVDGEQFAACENLDELDWDTAMENAEFEIY